MPEEKKMTTGGFFRGLLRYALTGAGENPVETVIKKGIQAHGEEAKQEGPKVIEVKAEVVKETPQACGDSDDGRTRKDSETEET